jgi:hypothetical protein
MEVLFLYKFSRLTDTEVHLRVRRAVNGLAATKRMKLHFEVSMR